MEVVIDIASYMLSDLQCMLRLLKYGLHIYIQVTRLNLYFRLEKDYNAKRLNMEEIIEGNRAKLGSLQYQKWFKRNYHILNAEVEGIFLVGLHIRINTWCMHT